MMDSIKTRRAAVVVTMQTPRFGICWNQPNNAAWRCHPASGSAPALDSRGVVAPDVSFYLGLLTFELPFRRNLSEGSVLFNEYSFFVAQACISVTSPCHRSRPPSSPPAGPNPPQPKSARPSPPRQPLAAP